MKSVLVAAAMIAASGLPTLAQTSTDMECSHYNAMKSGGQMAAVDSMRSRMPAANKMASSHEMAKKVAASCKQHPEMMVHEAVKKAMPH